MQREIKGFFVICLKYPKTICAILLLVSGVTKYLMHRMEVLQNELDNCNQHAQLMETTHMDIEARHMTMDSITFMRAMDVAAQSSYRRIIQPTIDSIKIQNRVQ